VKLKFFFRISLRNLTEGLITVFDKYPGGLIKLYGRVHMQRIHHIGIAVNNLDESLKIYETFLKDIHVHREEVPEQKVKVAGIPLGDSTIELLEPVSPDSPIAQFIEKKGTGIHHMAIEVDNIEETLKTLENSGYKLIDKTPRIGAMGMKIAFVHPKSTGGVLLEICQVK
jgi:methylmalonyl-CoA/ethylmalonyl-CoA epimerase